MCDICKHYCWHVVLTVLLLARLVNSSWIYLGVAASLGLQRPTLLDGEDEGARTQRCTYVAGLVPQQLHICQDSPDTIASVGRGAQLGLDECQYQFRFDRWNCTAPHPHNQTAFDSVLQRGTKETAFIRAVTSAGVVFAVTAACSAGNLTDCSCDSQYHTAQVSIQNHPDQTHTSPAHSTHVPEGWKWGGCSDNIDYGVWFAETFVDAPDRVKYATSDQQDVKALVNLHNNEVGRKVMSSLMSLKCRCHGISGSCGVKTCWKAMSNFRRVGDNLRAKYENSVEISPHAQPSLRRREKRMRREPIPETELVYVERSPNYCRQDLSRGVLGTRGRECQKGGRAGSVSCESLCCGRGYYTHEVHHVERCHCRFVWCCEVKCKTCETVVDRHVCK